MWLLVVGLNVIAVRLRFDCGSYYCFGVGVWGVVRFGFLCVGFVLRDDVVCAGCLRVLGWGMLAMSFGVRWLFWVY